MLYCMVDGSVDEREIGAAAGLSQLQEKSISDGERDACLCFMVHRITHACVTAC